MTNEEFQRTVLEELRGIKEDVKGIKEDVSGLKEDVSGLKKDVSGLKKDVSRIEKKVDAINEQTADLTEFKIETEKNIKGIIEDNRTLKEMVGRHDIEIETLKRKIG